MVELVMMRRRSLLFPLVGLLILTVFSTMGVGYVINHPFLYQALHDNAKIENAAQAAQIGFMLEHESNALVRLAHVIAQDGELQAAFTYYQKDYYRLMRKVLFLADTIEGVDFFSVADSQGEVLYSTNDGEIKLPVTVVQNQNDINNSLILVKIDQKWSVLALSPVMVQGKPIGILMLGLWINQDLARRLMPKNSQGVAFGVPDHGVVASFDLQAWPSLQTEQLQACIAQSQPTTLLDEAVQQGLYYAPIQIANTAFCLILPLNLGVIHQTLQAHTLRLAWSSLIIIFMLLLLAMMVHYLILKPLQRLHNKALILVEVCSNENVQLVKMKSLSEGNEIHVLDQAFETASSAIYSYIGELSHQKERFEDMAVRDPLTGLGNRRFFTQLVDKAMAYCSRYQRSMAVMYLDLDHFKPINDTLGHDIGDLLLKEVSTRLQRVLRDTDVVFRLGGDEFAALLPECNAPETARSLGKRLINEVAQPYLLNGHHCLIGVSVGIALFPEHADSLERLLKYADLALYAAKDAGRGVCRLYSEIQTDEAA